MSFEVDAASYDAYMGRHSAQLSPAPADLTAEYVSFDEWWEPYTLGVGPAGAYVRSLGETDRSALRERCRTQLPEAPFSLTAVAWAARGRAI